MDNSSEMNIMDAEITGMEINGATTAQGNFLTQCADTKFKQVAVISANADVDENANADTNTGANADEKMSDSTPVLNVFFSAQQTMTTKKRLVNILLRRDVCNLSDVYLAELENIKNEDLDAILVESMKSPDVKVCVSNPPFNCKEPTKLPTKLQGDKCTFLNLAVHGPRISPAVQKMFTTISGLMSFVQRHGVADRLNIALDDAACKRKDKMFLTVAKLREMSTSTSMHAADNILLLINKFCELFTSGKAKEITTREQWNAFLENECGLDKTWQDRTHFNDVLQLFGCTDAEAKEVRETKIYVAKDNKYETLKDYSVAWIAKILGAYRILGCLTDICNLVYAIMQKSVENQTPADIENTFEELTQKLLASDNNRDGLWIPTHIIHDAEMDDILSCLLIIYLNPNVHELIQLPGGDKWKAYESYCPVHEIFCDPASKNEANVVTVYIDAICPEYNDPESPIGVCKCNAGC